ncbi:MAG: chorismate mutase [Acetobacteraceae bacterium]|nr:chorismate mutase [Acetobacteraceae bacterium]
MPNTTPPPTKTTEAPAPEEGWRPDLGALRARLDDIDDKIHDLLMDRAHVVEGVARTGKAAAFRPGREASILRRLLSRHTGALPARTLVRMWRELLAGTTAMQTQVTVSVTDSGAIAALAREHFGFLTPIVVEPSVTAALAAVRTGAASIAVLPFPFTPSTWAALTTGEPRLYITARLPFWTARPDHVPSGDALVVTASAPDASGIDRSFLALTKTPDRARLADAGLTMTAAHGTVAEVEGLVTEDDPNLPEGAIVLGGYAVPVAGETA